MLVNCRCSDKRKGGGKERNKDESSSKMSHTEQYLLFYVCLESRVEGYYKIGRCGGGDVFLKCL